MARNSMFSNPKYVLVVVACICFALAVLTTAGILSFGKIDWTNLGLFFGFLSFIV
jgi:5,10-methenyltetrahydromethanopterin hydrogenase